VCRALVDAGRVSGETERRVREYKEAPGFRPGGRYSFACLTRDQAFALAPTSERPFLANKEEPGFRPAPRSLVNERRFRVYKEAPGFRPGSVRGTPVAP